MLKKLYSLYIFNIVINRIFITSQLHVHILKVINCHLQQVFISAKMSELLISTKLHVEFKNNSWNNKFQPHWVLHPILANLSKYASIELILITGNIFSNK